MKIIVLCATIMKTIGLIVLCALLLSGCSSVTLHPQTHPAPSESIIHYGDPSYNLGYFISDVRADQQGNIWIARDGGLTEMRRNKDSTYTSVLFSGPKLDLTTLTIDTDDSVWGTNEAKNGVVKLTPQTHTPAVLFAGRQYGFKAPTGITRDGEGNIWVTNTGRLPTDVESVTELQKNAHYQPVVFAEAGYHFHYPGAISADPTGNIWVANYIGNASGADVTEMKKTQNGRYQPVIFPGAEYGFHYPAGLTTDKFGNVWVSSEDDDTVTALIKGPDGQYHPHVFSDPRYRFNAPQMITADSYGNIWVLNTKSNQVTEIMKTGKENYQPRVFSDPDFTNFTGITTDFEGNIWIATPNKIIEILN